MSASHSSTTTLDQLFLGRQPILDPSGALIGYELLFRDSNINRANAVMPGVATAAVVCKAFAELGLAGALGGNKAFLIADTPFLQHEAVEALPPEQVVFEVAAAQLHDAVLMERCLMLNARGYAFCLTDPAELDEATLLFLRQSMFMKMNIKVLGEELLTCLLNLPAEFRPLAIASHVETAADHAHAKSLGFQFFQGYYFAEPTLVEGKKLDPATQGLIRIINLIHADADGDEIEQAFKGETAITVKLLRLTNSVGVGLRVRIGSVKQAINVIGRRHIQRWLQLLLYSNQGAGDAFERNPLMQLAALKGRLMESVSGYAQPRNKDLAEQAFLVGMMSLLPAALGMRLEAILEQIDIAIPLREALLAHEGDLGHLLSLTECFDSEDIAGTQAALEAIGPSLSLELMNRCLTDSIAWVQALATEAE
jgi:c-di-GMP-related signal transduction protein